MYARPPAIKPSDGRIVGRVAVMKPNPVLAARPSWQRAFTVESWGIGQFFELRRIADGATVFLQGDDALQLAYELDQTTDAYSDDDVASQYFD